MLYTIKDNASGVLHFDYVNCKYYAVSYEESKRYVNFVEEEHVTWRERLREEKFELYWDEDYVIAYLEDGVYWFVTQGLLCIRDVPLDELLWHMFTPEHMMFGKTLYVYCIGEDEFEFSCEKIHPDNQLVGTRKIFGRDTFFELCGIRLDVDDCYEIDENSLEWAQELTWYIDRGLQGAGNGRLQVVDWALFFEYVASEWEVEFVYWSTCAS